MHQRFAQETLRPRAFLAHRPTHLRREQRAYVVVGLRAGREDQPLFAVKGALHHPFAMARILADDGEMPVLAFLCRTPVNTADVRPMAREQTEPELRTRAGVRDERATLNLVRELHDGAIEQGIVAAGDHETIGE